MRTIPILTLVLVLATPATLAAQTVYKCTEENGTVVYSEQPCAADPAKVETIDTSESLRTGSGGYIDEQSEFARMNQVRRNCETRMEAIGRRYAGQYRRLSDQIEGLEERIANVDRRLAGSAQQGSLQTQLASAVERRDRLGADEAGERAVAQQQCDEEIRAEEERQQKAQAERAEAKRKAEEAAALKAAAEQAAADKAAAEAAEADKRRVEADAKAERAPGGERR